MERLGMLICECGRIHFYHNDKLTKLLEEDKELVIVCSNCGNVYHIGADRESAAFFDEDADPNSEVFNMYTYIEREELISPDNFDKQKMSEAGKRTIGEIVIGRGIGVMMATGEYADYYGFEGFRDCNSKPEPYADADATNAYEQKRSKVNMNFLIRTLTDEQADALSAYLINNLEWTGTRWEKKWN